jgi:hypothetical protein
VGESGDVALACLDVLVACRYRQDDLLHAVLSGVDEGEDVVVGAFEDAFEDCQVGHDAAGVEVLGAVEDDLVAL